jgi:hypothetical protein
VADDTYDPVLQETGGATMGDVLTGLGRLGKGVAQYDVKMTEGVKQQAARAGQDLRDILSGETPYYPGLRREDVTDIPGSAQPSDPFIGKTTDLTGDVAQLAYGMGPTGSMGVFVGAEGAGNLAKAGKPQYLQSMVKADQLLSAGTSLTDIYRQTGVHIAKDGQWRVEVPDYQSGFKPEAVENLLPRVEGGTGITGLSHPSQFVPATISRPPAQDLTMGDIYHHPDLFTAHPELANRPVKFEDLFPEDTQKGYISRAMVGPDGTIYFNPSAFKGGAEGKLSPQDLLLMRDAGLHELQHGVQDISGMAQGGSTTGPTVEKRAAELMTAQPGMKLDAAKLRAYKELAGETEARNVQSRKDLTPAKLAKYAPWKTQDIPYADQLLRLQEGPGAPMALPKAVTEPLSFSERMARDRDVAFQRAQRGTATGDYGLGSADFAQRQQQGYRNSMADILDAYRERTGLPRQWTQSPLLAPGETREVDRAAIAERQRQERLVPKVGQEAPGGLFGPKDTQGQFKFQIEDLINSPHSRAGVPFQPAAPYLRNPNAPLFDYSRLGERIVTPQYGLERTASTDVTPDFLRAGSKENIARVNKIVEQGIREGGLNWHGMQPLLEEYQGELGRQRGSNAYLDYMRRVGATSPNSNVEQNFRTASYYDWLIRNGLPLPRLGRGPSGQPVVLPGEIPNPYGNKAQGLHVTNLNRLQAGEGYPLSNPKPPSFAENMMGNYTPVAVDRHNMTLWGLDREPNLTGYRYLEDLQQQQARRMGIEPAQYQAAGWLPYAKSGTEPALQLFENRIAATAGHTGLSKADVLRQFIRGKLPLR